MALIICEECGKEISEQATTCPHCGCPINNKTEEVQQVEITSVKIKPKNTKKILAIILAVLAMAALVGTLVFMSNSSQKKKEREEFISLAQEIRDEGLIGAAKCEKVCNLTQSVWYNTIYEESDAETDVYTKTSNGSFNPDFNTSLSLLFASTEYTDNVNKIESAEDKLRENLSRMEEIIPEDLKKCYELAETFCKSFYSFVDIASSPTGSLTTYADSFSSIDTEVISNYEELKYELEKVESKK